MLNKTLEHDNNASNIRTYVCVFLVTAMLFMQSFVDSVVSWSAVHDYIHLIGATSELTLVFLWIFMEKNKVHNKPVVICLVVYLIWLCFSRILNVDLKLAKSMGHIQIVVLDIVLLYTGMLSERTTREKMLRVISVVLCSFFFVLSAAGIYAAIFQTNVVLPLGLNIELIKSGSSLYVSLESSNRNACSMWVCMCFCLTIYQFAVCRKHILRIPIIISGIAFYVFVALTMSRASVFALATAAAMAIALIVDKKLQRAKPILRFTLLPLIALAICVLTYKSAAVCCEGIDLVHNRLTDSVEEQTDLDLQTSAENGKNLTSDEDEVEQAAFVDSRSKENTKSLSGRVSVWKSVIYAIALEPDRLLKGRLVNDYMNLPNVLNTDSPEEFVNAHNYLLDSLALTGLPGFIAMLLFSLFLVIRMLRVFFSTEIEMQIKLLTIPLAATFVKNMMESMIFRAGDVGDFLFSLIAGIFLAYSYEQLPLGLKKSKEV